METEYELARMIMGDNFFGIGEILERRPHVTCEQLSEMRDCMKQEVINCGTAEETLRYYVPFSEACLEKKKKTHYLVLCHPEIVDGTPAGAGAFWCLVESSRFDPARLRLKLEMPGSAPARREYGSVRAPSVFFLRIKTVRAGS